MKRILLIEDDRDLNDGLAMRFEAAGYEVTSAYQGGEGARAARSMRPDLILLDVGLPDKSGHEVARELSRHPFTREIPIVYLTARAELIHRATAGGAGATAYLVKPCPPKQLLQIVGALIESRAEAAREEEGGRRDTVN